MEYVTGAFAGALVTLILVYTLVVRPLTDRMLYMRRQGWADDKPVEFSDRPPIEEPRED